MKEHEIQHTAKEKEEITNVKYIHGKFKEAGLRANGS